MVQVKNISYLYKIIPLDETGWWLKEEHDTGFNNIILRDRYLPSNTYTEKKMCISKAQCYKFKIRDEGEDGICCEEGDGWYSIMIDGKHPPFNVSLISYSMKYLCITL